MSHAEAMTFRGVRRVLAGAVFAVTVAACGSASEVSPPTGVDELTIPTPSPDPGDFVGRVDNPWFPLKPGTAWTYDVSGSAGERTRTVSVSEGSQEIQGVATTVVHDVVTTTSGRVVSDATDYYAQDESGNVWWFGRSGQWQAGVGGAEAGLMMAASPRVGDGYRVGYLVDVVEDRAEVISIDATADTAYGDYDQVLVTRDVSTLLPGVVRRDFFAEGVGLVFSDNIEGPEERIDLTSVSES